MSRYIDADRFKDTLERASEKMHLICGVKGVDIGAVKKALDMQPTADVVEVVRCKDCVNYCGFEHCKNGICDVDVVSKRAVYPNDYCSYGERREENEG